MIDMFLRFCFLSLKALLKLRKDAFYFTSKALLYFKTLKVLDQ